MNLAIIPARGGSKRLPNKNILDFCGEPLIIHSINVALTSNYIDQIVITTDSNTIIDVVLKKGFSDKVRCIKRPDYLATDTCTQINVIEHVLATLDLNRLKTNNIVLLQPTSPLRTLQDIDKAFELFLQDESGSVVSFGELSHSTNYSTIINKNKKVDGFVDTLESLPKRSQDFEKEYGLNGAIYIFSAKKFMVLKKIFIKPCRAYIMPYERSFDIDEMVDFKICEFLFNNTQN